MYLAVCSWRIVYCVNGWCPFGECVWEELHNHFHKTVLQSQFFSTFLHLTTHSQITLTNSFTAFQHYLNSYVVMLIDSAPEVVHNDSWYVSVGVTQSSLLSHWTSSRIACSSVVRGHSSQWGERDERGGGEGERRRDDRVENGKGGGGVVNTPPLTVGFQSISVETKSWNTSRDNRSKMLR